MIHFARNAGMLQERFYFGSKDEEVFPDVVVNRLHAQAIAYEQQPPPLAVPQRKREHSTEIAHAVVAVLFVSVDDGLGVGLRLELVAFCNESRRQFAIVVDFAVEYDDDRTIFIEDWLAAA